MNVWVVAGVRATLEVYVASVPGGTIVPILVATPENNISEENKIATKCFVT